MAVLIIALMFLLMGWLEAQPAHAGISLEQQRIDRERSAQRKHELELARIQAEAYVRAAKYEARRCQPTIIYRRR